MSMHDLEQEAIVELPSRLETSAIFSPVTYTLHQSTVAFNAVNVGGSQEVEATNLATTTIDVG